ncbi:MAG: CHAP domain-containing protein [Microbacteriaceae bacterium]
MHRPSLLRRVAGLAAFLVIPGIVIGTSLPSLAVASTDSSDTASVSTASQDVLAVSADATALDVSRADFDATTQSELQAARAAAQQTALASAAAASSGSYSTVSGTRAAGDDYPWRTSSGLSPLGYIIRQCTDFVAWRLNQDAGSTSGNYKLTWSVMTPGGGSASQWASQWKRNGWKTSHTPVKGAVAWFYGNHVAYVKSVSGDEVNLEEYNWNGDGAYHTRTIPADEVALFLYPPPT